MKSMYSIRETCVISTFRDIKAYSVQLKNRDFDSKNFKATYTICSDSNLSNVDFITIRSKGSTYWRIPRRGRWYK